MSETTLMIGPSETTKALNDDKFLEQFPMFKTINAKNKLLSSNSAGCSSCRKKAIARNLTASFLNVLKTMPKEDAVKIKEYFGAGRMIYQRLDAKSGIYVTEVV